MQQVVYVICSKLAGVGPELYSKHSALLRISLDLLLDGLALSAAIDTRR